MSRLLFLLLLASLALPFDPGLAAELMVLHPRVDEPMPTRGSARLRFTIRVLQWHDGAEVGVFVPPERNPVHPEFAKESLNLFPRQLRRVCYRHLPSGAGALPLEVDSVEEMLIEVATTPGAIGDLPDALVRYGINVFDRDDRNGVRFSERTFGMIPESRGCPEICFFEFETRLSEGWLLATEFLRHHGTSVVSGRDHGPSDWLPKRDLPATTVSFRL